MRAIRAAWWVALAVFGLTQGFGPGRVGADEPSENRRGQFVRGNVNGDEEVNLADASLVLHYLFLGSGGLSCLDAADADDNGAIEVTDAVSVLRFLFISGSPPSAPFPACGRDPGGEGLGCETSSDCDGPPVSRIVGRTVDKDGSPLSRTKVAVERLAAVSGSDGRFEINGVEWAPPLELTATRDWLSGRKVLNARPEDGQLVISAGDVVLTARYQPDPCGNVVGRAAERGCGKVFVWGDEHVEFDEYLPASEPFWQNTLEWLTQNGCTGQRRTRLGVFGNALGPRTAAAVEGMGVRVLPLSSLGQIGNVDMLYLMASFYQDSFQPSVLKSWVEKGGALMTTVAGIGDTYPYECDAANKFTSLFGIEYDCSHRAPWGPVSSFEDHPIAAGLTPASVPFVNGRWVAAIEGFPSQVVARSGDCSPPAVPDCRKPLDRYPGTPAQEPVIVEHSSSSSAPWVSRTYDTHSSLELHIIGIYESESRTVAVRVDRTAPMVLALTNYGGNCDTTSGVHHWVVTTGPGAAVGKVMVSGIEPQRVTVPEGVQVESYSGERWLGVGYGEDCGGGNTLEMISKVERASGLKMKSYHGCYEASAFTFVR